MSIEHRKVPVGSLITEATRWRGGAVSDANFAEYVQGYVESAMETEAMLERNRCAAMCKEIAGKTNTNPNWGVEAMLCHDTILSGEFPTNG